MWAQAVYSWVAGLAAEDAAWLEELPFTLSLPSRRVLVSHAGLLPGVPLQQQALDSLYTVSVTCQGLGPSRLRAGRHVHWAIMCQVSV